MRWHQERWIGRAELHVFCSADRPPGTLHDVVWHGCVPNDELVREWLPSMDLFVLPTYSDMSPWAAVEAACIGLPVVSSAIGGLPDIVAHGESGFLLTPDDDHGFVQAIEYLLDDSGARARMAKAARAHFDANFDPAKLATSFFDRLQELVG